MRRLLITGMACVALAAVAGCGGDDEDDGGGAADGGQAATQTEQAPTATTETSKDRTSEGRTSESGKKIVVRIKDFAFDPARVEAKVGQTVEWVNEDDAPHNATQQGGDLKTATFGKGGKGSYTIDEAGTIDYICTVHPQMKGTIVATK